MSTEPTRQGVVVRSNGSTGGGQSADPIKALLERLTTDTLDPTFEQYGNFVLSLDNGTVRLWGNFRTVSAVFEIDGPISSLQDVIDAIRHNQATAGYVSARAAQIGSRTVTNG